MLIAILAYWSTIEPSHDRVLRADVAHMPRAYINGDKVLITNFRDFEYRSVDDFISRYEEREVDLSHLVSVDFYVSYWTSGPVAYTCVNFNFDNAPPVSVSIEARFEAHEHYDPIASLFKRCKLIYVVGDEFDIVRVRTNFRNEEVYRYPIHISSEATRLRSMDLTRCLKPNKSLPGYGAMFSFAFSPR